MTASLRGAALEAFDYWTQVIRFIDLEHTPKNLLIRAVRQPADPTRRTAAQQRFADLRFLVGVGRA